MFYPQGLPDTFITTGRKLLMDGQDRFINSIFGLLLLACRFHTPLFPEPPYGDDTGDLEKHLKISIQLFFKKNRVKYPKPCAFVS